MDGKRIKLERCQKKQEEDDLTDEDSEWLTEVISQTESELSQVETKIKQISELYNKQDYEIIFSSRVDILVQWELSEVFGQELVDRYEKCSDDRVKQEDSFVFACINAAKELNKLNASDSEQGQNYFDNVKTHLFSNESSDGETESRFSIERFLGEIMQNSIDHCSVKEDTSIDIALTIDDDLALKYNHNGRHFQCEDNTKKKSTMTGLFFIGTKSKQFNFMVGTFGVGFKSWTLHY